MPDMESMFVLPDDSAAFEEARPFTMPSSRWECVGSGWRLFAALALIALACAALLGWFAFSARGEAESPAVRQVSADVVDKLRHVEEGGGGAL